MDTQIRQRVAGALLSKSQQDRLAADNCQATRTALMSEVLKVGGREGRRQATAAAAAAAAAGRRNGSHHRSSSKAEELWGGVFPYAVLLRVHAIPLTPSST